MRKIDRVRRIYYAIVNPFADFFRFIFRPEEWSALCFLEYDGKILMERNNYRKMLWSLPGGGLKKNENPELGVKREILEELGIKISGLKYLGVWRNTRPGTNNMVHCFYKKLDDISGLEVDPDPNEVKEYGWHEMHNLPEPYFPELSDAIKFLKEKI